MESVHHLKKGGNWQLPLFLHVVEQLHNILAVLLYHIIARCLVHLNDQPFHLQFRGKQLSNSNQEHITTNTITWLCISS